MFDDLPAITALSAARPIAWTSQDGARVYHRPPSDYRPARDEWDPIADYMVTVPEPVAVHLDDVRDGVAAEGDDDARPALPEELLTAIEMLPCRELGTEVELLRRQPKQVPPPEYTSVDAQGRWRMYRPTVEQARRAIARLWVLKAHIWPGLVRQLYTEAWYLEQGRAPDRWGWDRTQEMASDYAEIVLAPSGGNVHDACLRWPIRMTLLANGLRQEVEDGESMHAASLIAENLKARAQAIEHAARTRARTALVEMARGNAPLAAHAAPLLLFLGEDDDLEAMPPLDELHIRPQIQSQHLWRLAKLAGVQHLHLWNLKVPAAYDLPALRLVPAMPRLTIHDFIAPGSLTWLRQVMPRTEIVVTDPRSQS